MVWTLRLLLPRAGVGPQHLHGGDVVHRPALLAVGTPVGPDSPEEAAALSGLEVGPDLVDPDVLGHDAAVQAQKQEQARPDLPGGVTVPDKHRLEAVAVTTPVAPALAQAVKLPQGRPLAHVVV